MTPKEQERLISQLDEVDRAPKTLDAMADWEQKWDRPSGTLMWHTALRLGGVLGGGVSARLKTPLAAWDRDVYGHIEVKPSFLPRSFRLHPVEWKPNTPHRNPSWAPGEHRLATYFDRWHPYELNREGAIGIFTQGDVGVAVPLPPEVVTFSDYLKFCAEVWKCPDIEKVPTPPWSQTLF